MDQYISSYAKRGEPFSGSILMAKGGKVLFENGYGMANLEHDVANTPRTKFRLGSMTKQFTAMAVLQLAERGKISIQNSVQKYIPDCPESWRKVTVHHLLTHTSGIPDFTGFPDYQKTKTLPTTLSQTIAKFKDKLLSFEPGEKFGYSNSGYILLAYLIEKVSGESYESFLKRNIFEPLGMVNTGHDSYRAILKHRASGYAGSESSLNSEIVHADYIDMSIPIGGGDLYSTVEDLYRWDQALYTEKLVSKKSLEAMFTPFHENYGYGWFIKTQFNRRLVSHGGMIEGFVVALIVT